MIGKSLGCAEGTEPPTSQNRSARVEIMPKPHPDKQTEEIIGIALEVHRVLGPHFQELTYQRALAHEFKSRRMEFGREVWVPVNYKGIRLHTRRVDFVVGDRLLEVKAKAMLEPRDFEQTLSYLRASGYKVGLLLNFGSIRLGIKRIVN